MKLWAGWKELLARKEGGEALALFRILVDVGALWGIVETVPFGVWRILWTNGGYLAGAPDPELVAAAMAVGAMAALALVLGLGARVAAFVALQACLFLFDLNPQDAGAHDRFTTNGL